MQDKQAQDKSGRQVLIRLRTEACVSLLRVWVLSVLVVFPLDHLPLGLAALSLYSPTHMSSRKCASVSAVHLSAVHLLGTCRVFSAAAGVCLFVVAFGLLCLSCGVVLLDSEGVSLDNRVSYASL